jgi:Werner syndrome ATP-dependent helicase
VLLCHFTIAPLLFCFLLQVKHSKTSASSYGQDFQELIETYSASRNFRGKGQKILHAVEPESESSSYDSLDDSASDDEEEVVDIKKNKVTKSLVKENPEPELDQYPGVDDFDGNG